MRARTRFVLDIALAIALVAAWRPTWTGISLHQWLAIAIIVPLFVHVVVNWEWTLRILRTFVERLLHTSRLNLVVDLLLLISTVAVMVSGFMVSPALLAAIGIRVTPTLAWHSIHSWTANSTIALLGAHFALHWRWLTSTAARFAERPEPKRARRTSGRTAPALASAAAASQTSGLIEIRGDSDVPRGRTTPAHRSRVGSRAKEAARERAVAFNALSAAGVTGALVVALLAGVGVASPLFASAASKRAAAAGLQTCPATGCTASTCHGTTHADPYKFYHLKKKASFKKRVVASAKKHTSAARLASSVHTSSTTTKKVASSARVKKTTSARVASASIAAKKSTASSAKKKTTARRLTCPSTGCTASRCHGAYHVPASQFY